MSPCGRKTSRNDISERARSIPRALASTSSVDSERGPWASTTVVDRLVATPHHVTPVATSGAATSSPRITHRVRRARWRGHGRMTRSARRWLLGGRSPTAGTCPVTGGSSCCGRSLPSPTLGRSMARHYGGQRECADPVGRSLGWPDVRPDDLPDRQHLRARTRRARRGGDRQCAGRRHRSRDRRRGGGARCGEGVDDPRGRGALCGDLLGDGPCGRDLRWVGREHRGRGRCVRGGRAVRREGARRPAGRGVRARPARHGRPLRGPPGAERPVLGTLPGARHPRRPAHDEHLPRCVGAPRPRRHRPRGDPAWARPVPRGVPVRPPRGPGGVPGGCADRTRRGSHRVTHPVGQLLRGPPPRRLRRSGPQPRGPRVRERGRDLFAVRGRRVRCRGRRAARSRCDRCADPFRARLGRGHRGRRRHGRRPSAGHARRHHRRRRPLRGGLPLRLQPRARAGDLRRPRQPGRSPRSSPTSVHAPRPTSPSWPTGSSASAESRPAEPAAPRPATAAAAGARAVRDQVAGGARWTSTGGRGQKVGRRRAAMSSVHPVATTTTNVSAMHQSSRPGQVSLPGRSRVTAA